MQDRNWNVQEPVHDEIIGKQTSVIVAVWILGGLLISVPYVIPLSPIEKQRIYIWWLGVACYFAYIIFSRRIYYYYSVSDAGLTEYFLGRKKRFIPWSQIRQIGAERGPAKAGSAGIVVTLIGAPLFAYGQKKTHWGYLHQWPNVFIINNYTKSAPIIEKYYGKLDY